MVPTTYETSSIAASINNFSVWPRQTLIWDSCRRPISLAGFMRGSPQAFMSLHQTLRSATSGGGGLFYKESPRFEVEDHQQHGPNVIRSQLVTGGQNWHMLGCYLSPRDVSTLESVSAEIGHGPELWISLLPDISIQAWNIQTETNATRRLHQLWRWS